MRSPLSFHIWSRFTSLWRALPISVRLSPWHSPQLLFLLRGITHPSSLLLARIFLPCFAKCLHLPLRNLYQASCSHLLLWSLILLSSICGASSRCLIRSDRNKFTRLRCRRSNSLNRTTAFGSCHCPTVVRHHPFFQHVLFADLGPKASYDLFTAAFSFFCLVSR